MKKGKAITKLISYAALGVVIGTVGGFSIPYVRDNVVPALTKHAESIKDNVTNTASNDENENTDNDAINAANTATLDEASKNTIELVKKVKPSVVCITTKMVGQTWFNQIYESEGAGSGVIFHEDESDVYIVTNAHVVADASSVMVSVSESDLVEAKLVGKDVNADLAVISVNKKALKDVGITGVTVVEFGDSSDLQVGESVVAIGNALGEGNTATAGIVSALSKDVNISGRKLTVIQTDAAINPGNSGGALVNSKGQVVGINTAKLAVTSVEGIGYSIASDVAKPIIEQIMNSSDTPVLGVTVSDIDADTAQQNDLPQAGALIQEIVNGGSADRAGLQVGDVITAFNGEPIFNSEQLVNAVRQSKTGDVVKITIIRNGATRTVDVRMLKSNTNF